MRNYKNKPVFQQVNTNQSFQKSTRKYPDPKYLSKSVDLQVKTNIVKPLKKRIAEMVAQQRQSQPTAVYMQQPIIASYHDKHIFHFLAQSQFQSNSTSVDPNCLWFKKIPSDATTSKTIKISSSDYVISNWSGDNFPSTFYLCFDGISGFYDKYGSMTSRLAALQLKQIQPIMQNQSLTYQLKYTHTPQIKPIEWTIPQSLTYLKMSLRQDDNPNPVQLPLVSPLIIQVQITQKNKQDKL